MKKWLTAKGFFSQERALLDEPPALRLLFRAETKNGVNGAVAEGGRGQWDDPDISPPWAAGDGVA